LTLIERVGPSPFDSADVKEYILAAITGLDKSEALLGVEPLYCTISHVGVLGKRGYAHI